MDGTSVITQISCKMLNSVKRPYHMGRTWNIYAHNFLKI